MYKVEAKMSTIRSRGHDDGICCCFFLFSVGPSADELYTQPETQKQPSGFTFHVFIFLSTRRQAERLLGVAATGAVT